MSLPTGERHGGERFFILAPYITFEAIRTLVNGERPEESVIGIVLAASSLVVMPVLGRAKQRIGSRISSSATASEGKQNLLCAYLAAALLAGLLGNALFGAWWLDPVVALLIAFVAIQKVGRRGTATPAANARSDATSRIFPWLRTGVMVVMPSTSRTSCRRRATCSLVRPDGWSSHRRGCPSRRSTAARPGFTLQEDIAVENGVAAIGDGEPHGRQLDHGVRSVCDRRKLPPRRLAG